MSKSDARRQTFWIEASPKSYDTLRERAEKMAGEDDRTRVLHVRDAEGCVILLRNTTCDGGVFRASGAKVTPVAHENIFNAETGVQLRSLRAEIAELRSRNGHGNFYGLIRTALVALAYETNFPEPPATFENADGLVSYVESLTYVVMEGKERVEVEQKQDDLDARVKAAEKKVEEERAAREQEKAGYERQIAGLKKQWEGVEERIGNAESDKTFAERQLQQLRQKDCGLTQKIKELEDEAKRYKSEREANLVEQRLRADIRGQGERIGAFRREIETLKSEKVGYDKRIEELEAENHGLRRRYDRSHNAGLREQYERLVNRCHDLEQRLGDRERRVHELEAGSADVHQATVAHDQKYRKYNVTPPPTAEPEGEPTETQRPEAEKTEPKASQRHVKLEGKVAYAEKADDKELIPDPNAETTAEQFSYLFGKDDRLCVGQVFEVNGVAIHRRVGRGGVTAIYRFGAIDDRDRLSAIVAALHTKFGITEPVDERVQSVRNYFTAGDQNGYNPKNWEDSKIVTLCEAALGARKSESTLKQLFWKRRIAPVSEEEKKYRVGDIRPILTGGSIRRPEPVYKTR